ncbi:MAG: metallophosphoesterase [Candidatus ainarchaeum sp.]|nr:metallophosphoesterase [Candidatus ainarchaeum sp.]
METINQDIRKFAELKGLFVSKESVELLAKNEDWKKILESLLEEEQFIIEPKTLEKKLFRSKISNAPLTVEIRKTDFKPQAKDRVPNFRVMSEYDVTGQSYSEGKVDDFLRLFRSKFKLLSAMLKERHNLTPVELKNLKTIPKNENVDVIGMVNKKWITKNKHMAFEIEDMETKCIVLIMQKEKDLFLKGERILEDNVVGIKGVKLSDEFIIIKEIFWPDLPIRKSILINEDVYSAGTSDFHVGSKYFLDSAVEKWLKFINGENLSERQKEQVGKLQYLFVNGDNIAGVGVYPGQFDDLLIKDLYDQYNAFEEIMLQIPEYIQVFICPGQHDAVRRAEPQPGISKEFLPRLHALRNFHFISSPSWVETEGLKNLVYHGPSIHDLISSVSFLSMDHPEMGMVELLKKRDLMPGYGHKNPYVPEKKDYMVIKEVPDLVWIGDMHHNGYVTYRGTTVLNGGCWEAQTDFEKKIGHTPTPGIFPMINLKNRKITEFYFLRNDSQKEINAQQIEEVL